MRCLLGAAGMLLLLRRRCCCSGPLLLLLGAAVCVFYPTLMVHRDRLPSGRLHATHGVRGYRPPDLLTEETRRFIRDLETLQIQATQKSNRRRQAVVLMGQHQFSDTEVQLYWRVLQQMDYEVQLSRYAETSSFLRSPQGVSGWSLLLCLGSAERGCLRRVSFSHLQRHQRVNLLPGLMAVFSDGLCHLLGRDQPTRAHTCRSTNQKLPFPHDSADSWSPVGAPPPGLVARVNAYVVVTSVKPLTAFLHDIIVVTTSQVSRARRAQVGSFLQQLSPEASHEALGQMKKVIGQVLQVAANQMPQTVNRCVLCYQLLTVTLQFSGSITPAVVQVDTGLEFPAMSDSPFEVQITRDLILEDTLHFLLRSETQTDGEQNGGCRGINGVCLSEGNLLLLLQFQRQMAAATAAFHLLYPSVSSSSSSSPASSLSDLLLAISCYYELQGKAAARPERTGTLTRQESTSLRDAAAAQGACVEPRLRQIYTDPPLTLTPPFSPQVKDYHTEVTFDTLMIRIRPEPISSACGVHLDEQRGPRMANLPVGLGNSRISILVTDGTEPAPVVMTIYTVHLFRESRPSLPMFGDHVTCSFIQDCGLPVLPGRSCGLEPFLRPQKTLEACSSGHGPGRWVVPCLSCSDNRTCDWREVAWQPDGCYHPLVDHPLLQDCMAGRRVLFIGDSTNRGMMYFLMERVNGSLADWGKAHDTLVYRNLNAGGTLVSYSYYPQFWLEKNQRPTFREALEQLLHRSRPLVNSNLTVLVVGGVQWLNTNHLRTVRDMLARESLSGIQVVVKSLGMGFHLPVDGIHSLSLREIQELHRENRNIIATAKHHGYEVIDTFGITMGRYKEFLQGRCACHFHEVEKLSSSTFSDDTTSRTGRTRSPPALVSQSAMADQEAGTKVLTYHVRGPVNQVYSEILLSRLCPKAT
ncbi:cadherin-like and PC-esterase domain-containing protein 1 [Aulostomus maculatus]